jgi:sterol-4alpha-carboxylate 3-dehydrogenase (decarboxylating)
VLALAGCDVTVFDIRDATFDEEGVKMVVGDLTKLQQVRAAFKGMDVVFHVASPPPLSNNVPLFEAVNINGTQNVVDACLAEGVARLVFTSSASVVYEGSDQAGADETLPYPAKFRDDYCRTKAMAEQIVIKAGKEHAAKLSTVTVRPHGIFGPSDPLLLPKVAEVGRTGKNKVALGDTLNVVDYTYVGNVVHGHMLAAQAAVPGSSATGKVYFITNDCPVPFWAFMGKVLLGLGYSAQTLRLPYPLMLGVAHIVAGVVAMLGALGVKWNPTFNPSVVQLACTHHWYSCEAAKKDLKYAPVWDLESALLLTLHSFPRLAAPGAAPLPRVQASYTAGEVAAHNTLEDLWVVINGGVYDLTEYVDAHPGGDKIAQHAGGDASEGFKGPQHPDHVKDTVEQFKVGVLK